MGRAPPCTILQGQFILNPHDSPKSKPLSNPGYIGSMGNIPIGNQSDKHLLLPSMPIQCWFVQTRRNSFHPLVQTSLLPHYLIAIQPQICETNPPIIFIVSCPLKLAIILGYLLKTNPHQISPLNSLD